MDYRRPNSLEEHEVGGIEIFDHIEWSSTCLLLVAVLTETWPYCPCDLSSGVGMRFVPSSIDLFSLLCKYVV